MRRYHKTDALEPSEGGFGAFSITEDHTVHFNLVPNKAYETEWKRFESEIDTSVDLDVFDGMEGQLTWDHINGAERGRWRRSPIALCLQSMMEAHKSEIGKAVWVEVNLTSVSIFNEFRGKLILVAEMSGLLQEWKDDYEAMRKVPKGKIYIEKDGFIEGIDGEKVQHWSCGIDVENWYYHDA